MASHNQGSSITADNYVYDLFRGFVNRNRTRGQGTAPPWSSFEALSIRHDDLADALCQAMSKFRTSAQKRGIEDARTDFWNQLWHGDILDNQLRLVAPSYVGVLLSLLAEHTRHIETADVNSVYEGSSHGDTITGTTHAANFEDSPVVHCVAAFIASATGHPAKKLPIPRWSDCAALTGTYDEVGRGDLPTKLRYCKAAIPRLQHVLALVCDLFLRSEQPPTTRSSGHSAESRGHWLSLHRKWSIICFMTDAAGDRRIAFPLILEQEGCLLQAVRALCGLIEDACRELQALVDRFDDMYWTSWKHRQQSILPRGERPASENSHQPDPLSTNENENSSSRTSRPSDEVHHQENSANTRSSTQAAEPTREIETGQQSTSRATGFFARIHRPASIFLDKMLRMDSGNDGQNDKQALKNSQRLFLPSRLKSLGSKSSISKRRRDQNQQLISRPVQRTEDAGSPDQFTAPRSPPQTPVSKTNAASEKARTMPTPSPTATLSPQVNSGQQHKRADIPLPATPARAVDVPRSILSKSHRSPQEHLSYARSRLPKRSVSSPSSVPVHSQSQKSTGSVGSRQPRLGTPRHQEGS